LSAPQKQAEQYQTLMNEVLFTVNQRGKEIAALPASPLKFVSQTGLDALAQRLVPIDQVASLEALPQQLAVLTDIKAELSAFSLASQTAALKQYEALLAQELAEFTEKSKEVADVPSDVLRAPLKA